MLLSSPGLLDLERILSDSRGMLDDESFRELQALLSNPG